ncbi:transferrin binding protein B TbpB [Moraxella macacae 0408225]|uniref:Transferrin-binding protein B n=1 Tax=Moraxella macacae 0408225 TaxID=1230338 RepID=L2FAC4_9GAMM|nr:transferrin-binding protein-like solute binding protein [Moraxella macacae]ELA09701.1 transferrin binding protein B TbpB [Moraxella macacae 0408225]
MSKGLSAPTKRLGYSALFVAVSSILLTACGGGGGSGVASTTPPSTAIPKPPATPNPIPNPTPPAPSKPTEPTYQDVTTEKRTEENLSDLQKPALGMGMDLKVRNWHPSNKEEKVDLKETDLAKLDGNLTTQPYDKQILDNLKNSKSIQDQANRERTAITDNTKRDNKNKTEAEIKALVDKIIDDKALELAKAEYNKVKIVNNTKTGTGSDFEHVRFGHHYLPTYRVLDIQNKIAKNGYDGGLYYEGKDPSKELPESGSVTYKGSWDFMTNAKNGGKYSDFDTLDRGGDRRSLISPDENSVKKHSSEFNVDFGNKKLTGTLKSEKANSTDTKTRYNITAQLYGNRFRGSATVPESEKSKTTEHPFTTDAKDRLEGGFYGPKAEELAGKFLTDDSSVFGVFGAKQEQKNNNTKYKTILDARIIGAYQTGNGGANKDLVASFESKELNNFGDARKLVLGSTVIDLVATGDKVTSKDGKKTITVEKPVATNKAGESTVLKDKLTVHVCCDNLQYMKFGWLTFGSETQNENNAVFLQGERTDKNMPTTGTAKYKGSWTGYLLGAKGTGGTATGQASSAAFDVDPANRFADFDVDFGKKSLTGKLSYKDDKQTTKDVFSITDGKIDGTGFTAKANTPDLNKGGFKPDSANTFGNPIHIKDAEVKGGFYGPDANEMGGSFAYKNNNGNNAAVVFGTKKQEVKK